MRNYQVAVQHVMIQLNGVTYSSGYMQSKQGLVFHTDPVKCA